MAIRALFPLGQGGVGMDSRPCTISQWREGGEGRVFPIWAPRHPRRPSMFQCVAAWMVVYRNSMRPVGVTSMASGLTLGQMGVADGALSILAVAGRTPAFPTPKDPFVDGSSLWHLSHSNLRTDLKPPGDMAKRMHAAVGKGDVVGLVAPYLASRR